MFKFSKYYQEDFEFYQNNNFADNEIPKEKLGEVLSNNPLLISRIWSLVKDKKGIYKAKPGIIENRESLIVTKEYSDKFPRFFEYSERFFVNLKCANELIA